MANIPINYLRKVIDDNDRIIMFGGPLDLSLIEKKYKQPESDMKPNGVWYSCGLEWIEWLNENEPTWFFEYIYKITIDYSNILVINNEDDFDKFNTIYKSNSLIPNRDVYNILWNKVSKLYDGIEICPYLWKYRSILWYNTFDVASGCIWNTKAILGFEQIL